ncbi:MAG: DUF192 domain-containing protein [Leptospiraceae bacterium]|nr:DUF192 domain-containing protein [Leptospiraceae bacterium]MCP5499439.1 DUF192 domain-containing protein [Leptospiraceae bacterium]
MKKRILYFLLFFLPLHLVPEHILRNPLLDISIGGKRLRVEIAASPEARQTGLMFRETMEENTGMLFIFPTEEYRTFWMKNTYLPLSIAYFGKDRILFETMDMRPLQTNEVYPSSGKAMYALEVNQGWYDRNGIKKGAVLNIPDGIRAY